MQTEYDTFCAFNCLVEEREPTTCFNVCDCESLALAPCTSQYLYGRYEMDSKATIAKDSMRGMGSGHFNIHGVV